MNINKCATSQVGVYWLSLLFLTLEIFTFDVSSGRTRGEKTTKKTMVKTSEYFCHSFPASCSKWHPSSFPILEKSGKKLKSVLFHPFDDFSAASVIQIIFK